MSIPQPLLKHPYGGRPVSGEAVVHKVNSGGVRDTQPRTVIAPVAVRASSERITRGREKRLHQRPLNGSSTFAISAWTRQQAGARQEHQRGVDQ